MFDGEKSMESPAYRAELTKFAVRAAMQLAIPDVIKAVEKLQWQGRVAKVTGTRDLRQRRSRIGTGRGRYLEGHDSWR